MSGHRVTGTLMSLHLWGFSISGEFMIQSYGGENAAFKADVCATGLVQFFLFLASQFSGDNRTR